jgi:hypothetical protein
MQPFLEGRLSILHDILRVTWQVAPLECPQIWRHCSRCKSSMPFRCSMKFRTNAQKKRIDVWLIYRCEGCADTWNLPVFERVAVGDLAPDEFQAIARNDPALARLYAFDRACLDRHSNRVEESAGALVEWRVQNGQAPQPSEVEILIRLVLPWRTRLDRLLAQQLGTGRGRLIELQAAGLLAIIPRVRNGLRSPIADGQRILIALRQDAASLELIRTIQARAKS